MRAAWTTIASNPAALSALVSSIIAIAGVILAALASIVGIGINNWFNSRRLEREQAHDREQREIERARAVRKDIFIDATEAMIKHINAVQSLANLSMPAADCLNTIFQCTPIVAKANLVSSAETAGAMAVVAQALVEVTHKIGLLRVGADSAKNEFDRSIASHNDLHRHFLQLMDPPEEVIASAKINPVAWERLLKRRETTLEALNAAQVTINASLSKFQQANFQLVVTMQEDSMRVRDLLRPVLRAVRMDIGYPASEATLDAMFAPIKFPSKAELASAMGARLEPG